MTGEVKREEEKRIRSKKKKKDRDVEEDKLQKDIEHESEVVRKR